MTQVQTWHKKFQEGGVIDSSAIARDEAIEQAQEAGIAAYVVDCDRARSRSAVLRAVVKAVDFPEFFGGNLDALFDCICDTLLDQKAGLFLWFDHLHSGDPALADDAAAILAVCDDVIEFAQNNERSFSYAVVHAGKHPDPEPGIAPTPYSGSRENE